MSPVVTGILVSTVPLLGLGLIGPWRWRLAAAVPLVIGAFLAAGGAGVVALSDIWVVPPGLGMTSTFAMALLWIAFGAVARTAGPLRIPGPPWVVALAMGAGLGEVAAAAILSAGASSPKGAARLALAAAGGGMVGRMGDPALLLIAKDHPSVIVGLIPLGLVMALVARPRSEDLIKANASNSVRTGVVVAVALAALIPWLTPWALVSGVLALSILSQDRRGHVDIAGVGWQVGALLLAVLAIVGGAAEQAAFGIEWGIELADWLGPPALVLASALLTACTDGTAMAILFSGVVDRSLGVDPMLMVPGLTAGVAVGGLAPLIASGSIRAGIWIWLIQVALAVAWACGWALL